MKPCVLSPMLFAAYLSVSGASASEICRFAGTTDFAGHVAAVSVVSKANQTTTVDVAARFDGTWLVIFHIHYLTEEISTWRSGQLQTVAVNNRYLFGDTIVRQQWDLFERTPAGLQAHRIEGKGFADFRRKYPRFAWHWDPATFGQPWLGDFESASPERRADLDLKQQPLASGLQAPLALAFYWDRFLPAASEDVPVFLPGFKHERVAELKVAAQGFETRTASVLYPALSRTRPSVVTAWQSPEHQLRQLTLDLRTRGRTAEGTIRQQGCQDAP